jgi:hypothetical protein
MKRPRKPSKFYLRTVRFGRHFFRFCYFNDKLRVNGSVVAPNRDEAKYRIRKLHPGAVFFR